MKLIDREKALKIAESYGTTNNTIIGTHSGIADNIYDEITKLPIIETDSAKQGKWITTWQSAEDFTIKCSNCNAEYYHHILQMGPIRYCPNCGTKINN